MQRAHGIQKTLRNCGFHIEALDITGYVPVTVAARLPQTTLRIESMIKRLPVVSHFGADYTVCGRKAS
jgi:hypothetical protein